MLSVRPSKRIEHLGVDRIDSLLDALAEVAAHLAGKQLHGFVGARRGAGRNRRAAHGTVLEATSPPTVRVPAL